MQMSSQARLSQRRRNRYISLTALDQRQPNKPLRLLAFDKVPHIRRAGITSIAWRIEVKAPPSTPITWVAAGKQLQRLARARRCIQPHLNKQFHRARSRGHGVKLRKLLQTVFYACDLWLGPNRV